MIARSGTCFSARSTQHCFPGSALEPFRRGELRCKCDDGSGADPRKAVCQDAAFEVGGIRVPHAPTAKRPRVRHPRRIRITETDTDRCFNQANLSIEGSVVRVNRRLLAVTATGGYSLSAPSSLPRLRSKVPSGKCPALRAASRRRQSEKPRAGRPRNRASAFATTSESSSVRSL